MASNREERFLMRQRGAGTRQVQDISFNLALPGASNAPLRPQRSGRSRRTPQPELAPQRSSRKTPESTQRLQPLPSSRRTPGTSGKTPARHVQQVPQLPPLRTPGTSRNRQPQRPSPYDIPSNEDTKRLPSSQPSQHGEQGGVRKKKSLGASATADIPSLPQPHTTTSTTQAKAPATQQDNTHEADALRVPKNLQGSGDKKRKKRKSVGQVPRKRSKPSLEQAVASSGDQPATSDSVPIAQAQSLISNGTADAQEPSSTPQAEALDSKPTWKTRKSTGELPNIRKKSTVRAQGLPTVEPSSSTENAALESQVIPGEETPRGRGRPRKSLPAVEESQEEEVDHQGSTTELAKSKPRGRPRKPLPVVDGDAEHLESSAEFVKGKPRGRPRGSLPVVEEDEDEEAEQQEPQQNMTKGRQRGRPRRSLPVAVEDEVEEAEQQEAKQDMARERQRGRPRKLLPVVEEDEVEEAEQQETKQELARGRQRGRPRKSLPVVEEDEVEEAEQQETKQDMASGRRRGRQTESPPEVEEDQDEQAERLEFIKDLAKTRPRGRPRKSDAPSEVIDETQPPYASQAPTTNKPRHSRASSETSETAARKPRVHNESIPITVHRLTRVRALMYEDDDQDVLAGPAPFPKKSGVNAIDVLSQICREMIAKSVDTLQRGAQNEGNGSRKAEWKKKRKAVEMFGDELDGRLFQMTEALDNNFALSTRLKRTNKERVALREELLNRRREREKIALRTDEIRRSHAQVSKAAQDENELNTMMDDIELAVHRCREQQDYVPDDDDSGGNGLEVLMQVVAATVSSAKGLGLLDRVKGFNAYLERAVSAMNAKA